VYLYWRVTSTITSIEQYFFDIEYFPVQAWGWTFYAVEICLTFGIWIGHSQRMFAVSRSVVTMDQLALVDDTVAYNARVSILLPTAGERLDIVMLALLGCISQRMWACGKRSKSEILKVLILDEKKRKGVLQMAAAVYALATLARVTSIIHILRAENAVSPDAKGLFDWWKNGGGHTRRHLYNDPHLNQACHLMEYMQKLASNEDGDNNIFGLMDMPEDQRAPDEKRKVIQKIAATMLQVLNIPANLKITPAYIHKFNSNPTLPSFIYYSRRDPGTPKVSPKAGNMNAALFPIDYPDSAPLVGDSTIIAVNDCRHQLQPNFLQRTVPYFFKLQGNHGQAGQYTWDKVAFVQTPQRFTPEMTTMDDPLGNHAAVQYDVINHGKDGIGAVSSSGHGSLWRVEALRGNDAEGKRYADPSNRALVGIDLGFRSEMLVEDTHTSIDVFRRGWSSRYVNEPGEHLSMCTHQPDSIGWRIKQVLRWHQGAVQLLFYKGIRYTSFGGNFPTVWHRVYAFDQATYYLQAIPGYILLLMPIIYGVTGESPFDTEVADFFLFFTPFMITAMLPTLISGNWRGVDSDKLQRDEQVWLSTTYVQIYAFFSMSYTSLCCQKHENAWAVKAPTWPLFAVFAGEFVAIGGALFWVGKYGFDAWSQNLLSVIASAMLAINALWPMVSLQMGWHMPSAYHMKVVAWAILGIMVVLIDYLGNLNNVDEQPISAVSYGLSQVAVRLQQFLLTGV
jgi:cellulose synthase/poly-beta-1,6-N-acetylglucosamine synthase-like glycosyltransferase